MLVTEYTCLLCWSNSDNEEALPARTANTSSIGRFPSFTLCSSDGSQEEDDGEDLEELDSAATGHWVQSGSVRRRAEHL